MQVIFFLCKEPRATTITRILTMAKQQTESDNELIHEKGFLPKTVADKYFAQLSQLEQPLIPWDDKFSWIPGGKPLPQSVYFYDAQEREQRPKALLEEIVQLVERTYDTKAAVAWCNLFRAGHKNDSIAWHQDQYGMSLFVLSLGATRNVEVRPHRGWLSTAVGPHATRTLRVRHGDLYHWTDKFDQQHDHRVPPPPQPAIEEYDGPRISVLVLAHPTGSNADPAKLQCKAMDPVYTGQCTCGGFLHPAKQTLMGPVRKCQACHKKYYYPWGSS